MKIFVVISLFLVCSAVGAEIGPNRTCEDLHSVWLESKESERVNFNEDAIEISKALRLFDVGAYLGYIVGWIDRDDAINLPIDESIDECLMIVGNWLEQHPEKWPERSSDCVFWALEDAFGLKE